MVGFYFDLMFIHYVAKYKMTYGRAERILLLQIPEHNLLQLIAYGHVIRFHDRVL